MPAGNTETIRFEWVCTDRMCIINIYQCHFDSDCRKRWPLLVLWPIFAFQLVYVAFGTVSVNPISRCSKCFRKIVLHELSAGGKKCVKLMICLHWKNNDASLTLEYSFSSSVTWKRWKNVIFETIFFSKKRNIRLNAIYICQNIRITNAFIHRIGFFFGNSSCFFIHPVVFIE